MLCVFHAGSDHDCPERGWFSEEKVHRGHFSANRSTQKYAESTPQIATVLTPLLGYAKTSELVKEASTRGKSVLDRAQEKSWASGGELWGRAFKCPQKVAETLTCTASQAVDFVGQNRGLRPLYIPKAWKVFSSKRPVTGSPRSTWYARNAERMPGPLSPSIFPL